MAAVNQVSTQLWFRLVQVLNETLFKKIYSMYGSSWRETNVFDAFSIVQWITCIMLLNIKDNFVTQISQFVVIIDKATISFSVQSPSEQHLSQ